MSDASPPRYLGSIRLGEKLGEGGEGTIYLCADRPGEVVKQYLSSSRPDADKQRKLEWMIQAGTPELRKCAAWPSELVRDDQGDVLGLVMPAVTDAEKLISIYNPSLRSEINFEKQFSFDVTVAVNLARAVGRVHQAGHVIGDVNEGNFLVTPDGRVTLIDCDSFQINSDEDVFLCGVGRPEYTPPELQGRSFAGLLRTSNHDAFGLAVLIFNLFYRGYHPYSGVRTAGDESSLADMIKRHRFAAGRRHAAELWPTDRLPLMAHGGGVAQVFERAFAPDAGVADRPNPRTWVRTLMKLGRELGPCAAQRKHLFWQGEGSNWPNGCPWCEMGRGLEGRTSANVPGYELASSGLVSPRASASPLRTASKLWAAIDSEPPPSEDPPLPEDRPWYEDNTVPQNLTVREYLVVLLLGTAMVMTPLLLPSIFKLLLVFPAMWLWKAWNAYPLRRVIKPGLGRRYIPRWEAVKVAERLYREEKWEYVSGTSMKRFEDKHERFRRVATELQELESDRSRNQNMKAQRIAELRDVLRDGPQELRDLRILIESERQVAYDRLWERWDVLQRYKYNRSL